MDESEKEHEKRRVASRLLTRLINDAGIYPRIRARVIEVLAQLDQRITALNSADSGLAAHTYITSPGPQFVRLHLSGDNAFDACLSSTQDPLRTGTSQWNMQILVNPWLPARAQEEFYAQINVIVSEVLNAAGLFLAGGLHRDTRDGFQPGDSAANFPLDSQTMLFLDEESGRSEDRIAVCDQAEADGESVESPQQADEEIDPERPENFTGESALDGSESPRHASTRHRTAPAPIVVIKNSKTAIRYLLAYTWHLDLQPLAYGHRPARDAILDGDQAAIGRTAAIDPLTMTLIGIAVLKPCTLQAVMAWSDLDRDQPAIREPRLKGLPLPGPDYQLRQTLTALCELADGSASPQHQRHRYLQRFIQFYDPPASSESRDGAPDTQTDSQREAHRKRICVTLDAIAGRTLAHTQEGPEALIDALTDSVHARELAHQSGQQADDDPGSLHSPALQRIRKARENVQALVRLLQRTSFPNLPPLSAAFSDDLALMELLRRHPYLNLRRFPFLGVDMAAVVRVPYDDQLAFDPTRLVRSLDEKFSARTQPHSSARNGTISHETTLVLFEGSAAAALLTLTSTTPGEVPFHLFRGSQDTHHAPLHDMHEQRKAAAALTEDYLLRHRLQQQYDLIEHADYRE
ncbi:hypothetical protein LMG31886_13290 [Xanthomonas hydrangeae]|nr:hypothetical protein LMG31885_02190 [Xanthomonas hydrangeae]CAD7720611.1 hypothetical protein LMG31885_02190 [Xanthomonas hydrangeae]CAD7729688.1 hypothetical protein LMG31886_13290 [Xanthomonas hydrangeae]CAD7729692.1 hypothetical protein LMG31886_13290 [Xanthomonas hydrangeae]